MNRRNKRVLEMLGMGRPGGQRAHSLRDRRRTLRRKKIRRKGAWESSKINNERTEGQREERGYAVDSYAMDSPELGPLLVLRGWERKI